MSEVPTTDWTARSDGETGPHAAPFSADWRAKGAIRHVFTHFSLELAIFRADIDMAAPEGHWWSPPAELPDEALPTLMRKVLEAALPNITRKHMKTRQEP